MKYVHCDECGKAERQNGRKGEQGHLPDGWLLLEISQMHPGNHARAGWYGLISGGELCSFACIEQRVTRHRSERETAEAPA
jgi:hypothetical protein